ncbi:hypothetical protein ACQP2P_25645 [Dactylosporangium sp. CA-139114]|uniref:hypothetical protein n=1 Tax=Dactylosporangium sp. CA-139114 TaxID=3239931 RepID=UPI003D97C934
MRRSMAVLFALLMVGAPIVARDGAAPASGATVVATTVVAATVVGGDPKTYHDAGETRPE